MLEGAHTVVNTTSLGMAGKPEFRVPLDALSPSAVVTDLVYTPLETGFLSHARSERLRRGRRAGHAACIRRCPDSNAGSASAPEVDDGAARRRARP